MGTNIYIFDNHTGTTIPSRIGTVPVECLLGNSVSELHNLILKDSRMFCIISPIKDYDIVVPSIEDKVVLEALSSFGKYNFKIKVEPESIWYTKKVWKNIVISSEIGLETADLATLLNLYITSCIDLKHASQKQQVPEIYIVKNNRKGEEIFRTPNKNEAIKICNGNPCNIIENRNGDIIYRSIYGKVSPNSKNHMQKYKSKIAKDKLSFTSK